MPAAVGLDGTSKPSIEPPRRRLELTALRPADALGAGHIDRVVAMDGDGVIDGSDRIPAGALQ